MHALRTLFAWWLLAVMAFAIAPQHGLHACAHGAAAHAADVGMATVDAACAYCALGVPVGTAVEPLVVRALCAVGVQCTTALCAGTALGHTLLAADRGPPSCA